MPVISIRMSASSSTMRISLAMPGSSFHRRHHDAFLGLSAATFRHIFAQGENETDDGAAALAVAQKQVAAVILHDLLHNCQPKSSAALARRHVGLGQARSEEHTSELQSLMRISYAV